MKKKILCFILSALMSVCSLPLSVFASEGAEAVNNAVSSNTSGLPVVTVTSVYSNESDIPNEFRAFPDDDGTFYLDIALDKAPDTPQEILVYYRTVDDTAVSKWGDYEAFGAYEEVYVSLNRANGYKARVTIKSTVLPAAISGDGTKNQSISRRFLFELLRVEGNAVLHKPDPNLPNDRCLSRLYCHLAAEKYIKQSYDFLLNDTLKFMTTDISTEFIYGSGSISKDLNYQFSDYIKAIMATGQYNLGLSIIGKCKETWFENDGPVTFDLYYTYQGVKRKAVTLIVEGEFDDSEFFGWEHAFDRADNNFWDQYGLQDAYITLNGSPEFYIDIWDFIDDNFYGYILYDNDGNVAHKVTKDESRDIDPLMKALNQAQIDGYAVQPTPLNFWLENLQTVDKSTLHYLVMPSNFVFADSYSWTVSSDGEDDEARRLEDVAIVTRIVPKGELNIATDGNGNQLVTTNMDQLRSGDPLRMMVRLNKLANVEGSVENFHITAKINGRYSVTLNYKNDDFYNRDDLSYRQFWDTLVFECQLPPELQGINITSITDITLSNQDESTIKSYITYQVLLGRSISDIRGIDRDIRTPVATLIQKSSDLWFQSKSFDIYVNTAENVNSRFNDYVTVYYQWSNSKELPESYSSKLIFNTYKDGEVMKNIFGSGNGEMYLHMKTQSFYGKSAISDALTTVYDPADKSAVYTPFGPFKFDNTAPSISASDIRITGSLKEQTISVPFPNDNNGSGLRDISLYYIDKSGNEVRLKRFEPSDFVGEPKTLTYKISHKAVGVGVDAVGNVVLARDTVDFYWVIADKIGNSSGKTAEFSLVFDTNDYLAEEIESVGPYNISDSDGAANFEDTTQKIDDLTYIYDYRLNSGKSFGSYTGSDKTTYYTFSFVIKNGAFAKPGSGESEDIGSYSVDIYYNGTQLDSDSYELVEDGEGTGVYVALIFSRIQSGRYDLQLKRTEGESMRVSNVYSVYATDGENDDTVVKNQIENGTLLSNTVYQLSAAYPYFYYKDNEGAVQKVYYNGTNKPATFSSISKAKEYVYYKELSDIYLVRLTAATASALNSGTAGYLIAKGETAVPRAGQYWIRYKSNAWTPTSGESAWVYYYYGESDELAEGALSVNLLSALNAVANRIVGYGKAIVLTDASLFLGNNSIGDRLLDEYGMPYLAPGQVHITDELSMETMCGNAWSTAVGFAADKNIYKSKISVGVEGTAEYNEIPIIGKFSLPEDAIFQYMTYEQYKSGTSSWQTLNIKKGEALFDVFKASGVYYIREISTAGVSVCSFYVDKEAPKVTFSRTDENGSLKEIPVDGKEIVDIRTKDLYIGSIDGNEYDRLSYVAIYKVSDLSLVDIYTAADLDFASVKLEDGNYYIIVSDRSGNRYTVTAKVSSTPLECSIKESVDKHIKLTCNRKDSQIQIYEVYLNGVLLTSEYKAENTFTKAGLYTIYVQDIYGNEFFEEYLFERNYPTVTWKYYGPDGKYHTYNQNDTATNGFILTWVSDNQYKISTAVKTRFSFSGDYAYEFIGTVPKYSETPGAETNVTIEAGQSFTLKVYYKSHPDCYSVYSGVVDVTPPTVNVSAEVDELKNGEYDLFDKWIENGAVSMEDIYYVLAKVGNRTVEEGKTVASDFIKINVSDVNGLSLVEVYHDGKLIKTQTVTSGFSHIIVSKWGKYRIVAKDSLGNVCEFTFTNGMPDNFDYFVDGAKKEPELHGYLNFEVVDGKYVYKKIDFGKKDFKLNVKQNADVFMSVGVSGGTTEIYGFRISDGQIYSLTYKIVLDKDGNKAIDLVVGEALINMNAEDFKSGKEYLISKTGAYSVYASIGSNKTVTFKVYVPEDSSKVVSVGARLEVLGSNTTFVSAELSKKSSSVSFEGLGIQTKDDIRINSGFTVDESTFEDERIVSISLYYSRFNDLDASKLADKTNIYITDREYDDEGFYLLIVRNHYGNERVYKISILRSFGITSSVTFGDGHKIFYSNDYDGTLYSNSEVTLDILDEDVTVDVTMNGAAYTGFARIKKGEITYLVFSEEGTYEVTLTDSYGNKIIRRFDINKATYTVADELLTGYNEKAIKRDEGYTNQKLSVNKAVYDSSGIYYLAIQYGKTLNVLFDAFAESPVTTDAQKLVDIIGANGDGVYKIICRNRYGAVVTKDIHYRGTPTLKLERTTRSKTESEVYDLSYAISHGFWSNNTLSFSTDAKTYVFTVNGSVTECPRTLVFENAGDFGSFEYEITYIDEYGFEYSFKAYLVRKNVEVEVSSDLGAIEMDGVLNTKKDVSITFGENICATYTRNNGEEVVYHSGDVLKKDGTYRFTVVDYAGNATSVTIKKDTAVEFSLTDSVSGNIVQNGSVVNSSKIGFNDLNNDSAYIEKVIHNGAIQADFSGSKFTKDGKWELIICDKLGNRAYFCFYIVTRDQNGFAYTTPYEYRITEMWYDSGDGIKVSYMTFVSHSDFTSSFDFTENGNYTVVMTSDVTGMTSTFEFTVNTSAPAVSLVGCNNGETTINDVSLTGYKVGDTIRIYRATKTGEELVEEVEITSLANKIPTISEGGKYRIVVESEAGVQTELLFVRKHVMNTAGSVFIMVVIGLSVVGLFTGLVYRNKSKTDD